MKWDAPGLHMPPDSNLRRGFILLETLVSVVLLSIIATTIIRAIGASLAGSEKIRDSFEASVLMENLLFNIKSDENGARFSRSHEGGIPSGFMTPRSYSYRVDSRILGTSEKGWGERYLYQDLTIRLAWKGGREFVLNKSVVRTKVPYGSAAP